MGNSSGSNTNGEDDNNNNDHLNAGASWVVPPRNGGYPDSVKVILVGMTETGKSHFLVNAIGDGTDCAETSHPTFGTYAARRMSHCIPIDFLEIGSNVCKEIHFSDDGRNSLCDAVIGKFFTDGLHEHSQRSCYIMWFIDSHDSELDILGARNQILMIRDYFRHQISLNLMVVQNNRRPRDYRRTVEHNLRLSTLYWKEPEIAPAQWTPIEWEKLWGLIDGCGLQTVFPRTCLVRYTYLDPEAIYKLLDWFIA